MREDSNGAQESSHLPGGYALPLVMTSSKDLSGFVPIAPVNVADFEATDYKKVSADDRT